MTQTKHLGHIGLQPEQIRRGNDGRPGKPIMHPNKVSFVSESAGQECINTVGGLSTNNTQGLGLEQFTASMD